MKTFYLFALTLLFSGSVLAQDCEVSVPELQGKYNGECKNKKANGTGKAEGTDSYDGVFKSGYPSGEGTYTYKNGDYYQGNFKKGMKDGKGQFHYKRAAGDSIVDGYWKNNVYTGSYAEAYKLIAKTQGLYNVEIHEEAGQPGRLLISSENVIRKNTLIANRPPPVPVITYINVEDGGSFERDEKATLPRSTTYSLFGMKFPFHAKVFYQTDSFEFIISKPGMYRIDVQVSER